MLIVDDEARAEAKALVQKLEEIRSGYEFTRIKKYLISLVCGRYKGCKFSICKLESPWSSRCEYYKVMEIYNSGLATMIINNRYDMIRPIREISIDEYITLVQLVKLPDFKERLVAWIKAIYERGHYPWEEIYLGKKHKLVHWFHFIYLLLRYYISGVTDYGLDVVNVYEWFLNNRQMLYKRKKLSKWRKALNRDYDEIVSSIIAIEQFDITGDTFNIYYQLYDTYAILLRVLGGEIDKINKVKRAI